MKSGFLPQISHLLLIMAVCLSFLPLILYWGKQLAENKAYMVIAIFWMINGILYLPDIFHWNWYQPVTLKIILFYNLIDAPIICLVFYYALDRKFFLYLIFGFFAFELIVIVFTGFNLVSNNIIIGSGSLLCLILNVWGLSRHVKKVTHTENEKVLAFVFAGFVFYYGLCVDILLISKYLKLTIIQGDSIMMINYIAILLATILISFAFWKYAKPSYLPNASA